MATVYLAEDRKLDRRVAIKVLRPDLASAVGPERFLREVSIAAKLQHPGILDLYDSGSADGFLYYVMPYVEGESLRERLEGQGEISLDAALRIACDIAEALAYAHEKGVVHRDVKPENILLSGERAVIADFGIAKAVSEADDERLTASGHAVGTPAYMSPEQARGETDLDGRSDIYALGCVLYEMLVREPPFPGQSAQEIIAGHMFRQPRSVRDTRPEIPVTVDDAVTKALAKAREDRFAVASHLGGELVRLVGPRGDRRPRKHVSTRLTVGAIAIGLLALTVFVIWRSFGPWHRPLDPNKVVVFPLVDLVGDSLTQGAGVYIAIAIEGALDHAQPLKWIDAWDRLDLPAQGPGSRLSADVARSVSQGRGAGYYIEGSILPAGDSLRVVLRLHDVEGDSIVAVKEAAGARDRWALPSLGLTAATDLIPKLVDPERGTDLSPLADRDPSAIALWVQGEREYRLARFATALEFYNRAIIEDSLLVLAAVKGAQAAGWKNHFAEASQLIELAVSQDSLLPTRYRHLARGFKAFREGQANTAVESFESALAENPGWSEAATYLGETYYHLFPPRVHLDSLAEAMFDLALANDSAFTPPMVHLVEIALRRESFELASLLLRRLMVNDPDTSHVSHLILMADCVRDGPESFSWENAARRDPDSVLAAAKALAVAASHIECAESGFRAVLDEPAAGGGTKWGAFLGLQGVLVADGSTDEALALIDSVENSGYSMAMAVYIVDVMAGAPMELEAVEVEKKLKGTFGERYERGSSWLHWLMATWHAYKGDVATVRVLANWLKTKADESGEREDTLFSDAVAAHLNLVEGDTLAAVRQLRDLAVTAPREHLVWGLAEPLAVEKSLLARLLLTTGEFEEANRVAGDFDHPAPVIYLTFLRQSLEVRFRAAEALNRHDLASRYMERLRALGGVEVTG
jgi:tetratricopeptide (TPR) repeat protein